VLNGILIVAAIVIVGAFLSVRRARRRDEQIHAMHARADNSSGADSFGGFPFFSSDAASGPSHHHHPGDPTGDWPSASDGGASGGGGASGAFDSGSDGGGADAGGGSDGGGGGD